MLSHMPESDRASSPVTGVVLLIGITVILAMLVLLLCLGFRLTAGAPSVPSIFVITQINHVNPNGIPDNDSYVVIENTGKIPYDNRNLCARAYRNGQHIPYDIPTMNGYDFLSTHHFGIQKLGGFGSCNFLWYPGATLYIDYEKGTFHPGDLVQFEVYERSTGMIISRDSYPGPKKYDTQWFYNYFLNPQAA
jgi:flagellin-like protein